MTVVRAQGGNAARTTRGGLLLSERLSLAPKFNRGAEIRKSPNVDNACGGSSIGNRSNIFQRTVSNIPLYSVSGDACKESYTMFRRRDQRRAACTTLDQVTQISGHPNRHK